MWYPAKTHKQRIYCTSKDFSRKTFLVSQLTMSRQWNCRICEPLSNRISLCARAGYHGDRRNLRISLRESAFRHFRFISLVIQSNARQHFSTIVMYSLATTEILLFFPKIFAIIQLFITSIFGFVLLLFHVHIRVLFSHIQMYRSYFRESICTKNCVAILFKPSYINSCIREKETLRILKTAKICKYFYDILKEIENLCHFPEKECCGSKKGTKKGNLYCMCILAWTLNIKHGTLHDVVSLYS